MIENLIRLKTSQEKVYLRTLYQTFIESNSDLMTFCEEDHDTFMTDCLIFGLNEGIIEYRGNFFKESSGRKYNGYAYGLSKRGKERFNLIGEGMRLN